MDTEPVIISVDDRLPRPSQWVMLVTPSLRCLGFLDAQGGWRRARDGSVIENVLSWHLMGGP